MDALILNGACCILIYLRGHSVIMGWGASMVGQKLLDLTWGVKYFWTSLGVGQNIFMLSYSLVTV